MKKKLFIFTFATIFVGILFSVLNIHFAFDISFFAFPLSAIFCALLFYQTFAFKKTNDAHYISIVQKFLQYFPFVLLASFILRRAGVHGTSYVYDVITVFLWCASFVLSLIALYFFSVKRVFTFDVDWKKNKSHIQKKRKGISRIVFETLDWIDALLQAVCMVLLIQIFIVQLYVIPSESMVPKFLIGDRVIVFKTPSGPKFPLSTIGFPILKKYKRGDVVVFRNPHYSLDRKSEVKTVTSQLVYMLTFMSVNLNRDENGNPKADPLVKHIVGLPGEQLVMQDGILYARTKNQNAFLPVEEDAKFASWNLNEVDEKTKQGIRDFPLTQKNYETLLAVEKVRRELDTNNIANECVSLANRFEKISHSFEKINSFDTKNVSLIPYEIFLHYDSLTDNFLKSKSGSQFFRSLMTDWILLKPQEFDIYSEANWKLNLMIKNCFGKLLVQNAELMAQNVSSENRIQDSKINSLLEEANMLSMYVLLLDQRNMSVFPPNAEDGSAQYIPATSYFMMGDNRFNSLDMRHSYEMKTVPLTQFDNYSFVYNSILSPQYVSENYILGTATFRFWPLSRIGFVK